ncbi:hypothetical protein IE81DRAFT_350814 [Ceraceosorus guamensis]|uniref:Uncharacterized protein n=1 Tax=Ceraceosorus guamensis TaxID=1522189 RepID=A0A316VMA5_9BASI|nr:hypothetical protein IE81DRAFT_350814 [Ceraceosorus guamensis]PWN38712.1 hypothetical protein IE81DRAFT_350814 [Ceraceosorus guamensis]
MLRKAPACCTIHLSTHVFLASVAHSAKSLILMIMRFFRTLTAIWASASASLMLLLSVRADDQLILRQSSDEEERAASQLKCAINDYRFKFLRPAPTAALEQGQEFEVIYCSGAYFKISSIEATLFLEQSYRTNLQRIYTLAEHVKPVAGESEAGYSAYHFKARIPKEIDLASNFNLLLNETTTTYGYGGNADGTQVYDTLLPIRVFEQGGASRPKPDTPESPA